MDFDDIRREVVSALFSDDMLLDLLVLKGGNAIRLVYDVGQRSSLDLDFSIENDFDDLEGVKRRIHRRLSDHFILRGRIVFDYEFARKPSTTRLDRDHRWGGYEVNFKLLPKEMESLLAEDLPAAQRSAVVLSPGHRRKFHIDISKHEYCRGKLQREIDYLRIFVYSPAMIVAEKLRAICQQMQEYPLRRNHQPRARDFYDIWILVKECGVDLGTDEFRNLLVNIFEAKEVSIQFLREVHKEREFHRVDWPSVQTAAGPSLSPNDFDYYFEFTLDQIAYLYSSWDE